MPSGLDDLSQVRAQGSEIILGRDVISIRVSGGGKRKREADHMFESENPIAREIPGIYAKFEQFFLVIEDER